VTDTKLYVPTLKLKRGEKAALRSIPPALRARIAPLIEVVERKDRKPIVKHLATAFHGLADSVAGYGPVFLDVHELAEDGERIAARVFQMAADQGIPFVPVTGLGMRADRRPALKFTEGGLALRITRADYESGSMGTDIIALIKDSRLDPTRTDMMLDLGPVDEMIVMGIVRLSERLLAELPLPGDWRTLTLTGCAFPKSMGIVDRNSHKLVERAEWLSWKTSLYGRRSKLKRLPRFGDSGIQHSSGVEGFDPRTMQVSAAIRYTTGNDWLLVKGVGTRGTPATAQFPRLAKRLAHGTHKALFGGGDHCVGCSGIVAAAAGSPGLGSPEVWRRLGTIHHLVTVADELAGMFAA
jgi:hypothetical protein